jgi:phosphate-selective porin
VEILFPMVKKLTFTTYKSPKVKSENIINSELRINHINHFEKYFSFHSKGKISEFQFSKFKREIKENQNDEALSTIKKILNYNEQRKVVYRIKSEIEIAQKDLERNLIIFLIDNSHLFSEISDVNPHFIEIIRDIADKLKINAEKNKELTLLIVKKLDYEQLSWFLAGQTHTFYSVKQV